MEKIKILILITELGPYGAERIVFEIATRLPADGFDVVVASLSKPGEFYEKKLLERGIRVEHFPFSKIWPFSGLKKLAKFVESENFALINAHLFHANWAAKQIAKRNPRVKVITTTHICEHRFVPWRFWSDSKSAPYSTAEVCVSNAVKKFTLDKTSIPEEKLRVIHNGISVPNGYAPKPYPAGPPVIGAVGRLDEQKGFLYLVKAMQIIAKWSPEAKLVIQGTGHLRCHLNSVARDLGVNDKVELAGFTEDVFSFYDRCSVVACPSLWEGFGLVAAEAQYAARPVVASDADSLPEIVADGRTGLLVPPEDVDSLATAIIEILSDRELAAELGKAGHKVCAESFSVGRMASEYAALFRSVIAPQ